jgi:hypothetical protein
MIKTKKDDTMGKYSAGIATQEKIVNSAKKLFYSNGYKKTTIKIFVKTLSFWRTSHVFISATRAT